MRYFVRIQYNGSDYHGWQYQPNAMSIQEAIESQLTLLHGRKIGIVGCGRTDTGVHAADYFFHFDSDKEWGQELAHKLNGMLDKNIAVIKIYRVDEKAHARFDADKRAYTYYIHFYKDPFKQKLSWQYPYYKLDASIMKEGAAFLLECDDFPMFCKSGSDVKNHICKIFKSELLVFESEQRMEYHIEANRFLRNMIRRIMGTLVQLGNGSMELNYFKETIRSKNAFKYINLAPPEGLYLSRIDYPFISKDN